MFKRAVSLIMSVIMLFSCVTVSQAAAVPDDSVAQPLYNYTKTYSTRLSISGGSASCIAKLTGYNGTTTKIEITMTLQKKTLLWWSTEKTWTGTINTYYGTLSKSASVGNGTYRVKAVYKVYSGTSSESITDYSTEVKV